MEPVEFVIRSFGGIRKTAKALAISPQRVSNWRQRGQIPTWMLYDVIMAAQARDIDLKPEDLIFGRVVRNGKKKRCRAAT